MIGGVCGGLFAYYREKPASGTQVRRIGEGMLPDSSAIVNHPSRSWERALRRTGR